MIVDRILGVSYQQLGWVVHWYTYGVDYGLRRRCMDTGS